MTSRRVRSFVFIGLTVAAMAACGKKGNPLPPLRPLPARIADFAAVRTRDRITLHFTVPAANADGTTPAAIDRVDIYRVILPPGAIPPAVPATPAPAATPGAPASPSTPAATPSTATGAPATTPAAPPAAAPATPPVALPATPPAAPTGAPQGAPGQAPGVGRGAARGRGASGVVPGGPPTAASVTADPKNLLTHIAVRRAPVDEPTDESSKPDAAKTEPAAKKPAAAAASDPRPMSGTETTFVDTIDSSAVVGSTRYYVAVPVVGNGRGRPGAASALIAVTLGELPLAPTDLALKFDETRVLATWQPAATGQTFTVLRTGEVFDPSIAEVLTPEPLTTPEFALPMQFGKPVCLSVKAASVAGAVRAEGPPSAPVCVTPVDRFPPPAPGGLQAVQEGAAVTLLWTHVEAADLGGYVVLRGDGATGTLQPLMRTPIQEVTYRDTTVQPGQTYTYAVYAVDTSAAANVSQLSDRQTIVIR